MLIILASIEAGLQCSTGVERPVDTSLPADNHIGDLGYLLGYPWTRLFPRAAYFQFHRLSPDLF